MNGTTPLKFVEPFNVSGRGRSDSPPENRSKVNFTQHRSGSSSKKTTREPQENHRSRYKGDNEEIVSQSREKAERPSKR